MNQKLAREFGTPIYVLEEAELNRSVDDVRAAFSTFPFNVHIAYPYKTNSLKRLCTYMNHRGLWTEVSSGLELRMALAIGVDPRNIIFNSPYKSRDDLEVSIQSGCKINIDNKEEFEKICSLIDTLGIQEQKIGIRVSPYSGDLWDKFGFLLNDEAHAMVRKMSAKQGIKVVGVHCHRSNIPSIDEYEDFASRVVHFASQISTEGLCKLEYIDLGSGFTVQYPEPLRIPYWTVPTMYEYAQCLEKIWKDASIPKDTCLIIEPGKRLVASSVSLLTKVVSIKERNGSKICFVNIGHNFMPGVDWCRHPIRQIKTLTNFMTEEYYQVHGCLCDSLDLIRTDVPLFSLEIDELLSIDAVGGYDMSRAFFWQLPRAPVLWIDKELNVELVRASENIEYLWQLST